MVRQGKIKCWCHRIIDLARKELEKDYCIMEPFDVSDLKKEQRELGEAIGRTNALKDMPKWKKATEHKDLEKHIAILEDGKVLLSNYLEKGDYYIDLEDLKILPKEE